MPPLLPRTLHPRAVDDHGPSSTLVAAVSSIVGLIFLGIFTMCCARRRKRAPTTGPPVDRWVTPRRVNQAAVEQEADMPRRMEASHGRGGLGEGGVYPLVETRRRTAESETAEREREERGEAREGERERLAMEEDEAPPPTYEEARKQPRVDV